MDSFYTIVLTIALFLLIVILTYVGIQMSNKSSNISVYPPAAQPCPDYWLQSADPTKPGCVIPPVGQTNTSSTFSNVNTPGFSGNIINFNDPSWSRNGATATCNQSTWASKNGIQWDGVSNFNGC
jgi:hypothetical protein